MGNPKTLTVKLSRCIFLLLSLTWFSCGGGGGTATPPVPTPDPVITSFTAEPTAVPLGGTAQLKPVFSLGSGMIDQGINSVSSGGSYPTGALQSAKTYTLTVSNSMGKQLTSSVTVAVNAVSVGAISPAAPVVSTLSATTFTAAVTGAQDTSVRWSASAGQMDAGTGTWTAPASPQVVTITATAVADSQRTATTQVDVRNALLSEAFAGSTLPAGWTSPTATAWSVSGGWLQQNAYATGTRYQIAYAPGAGLGDYRVEVDLDSRNWDLPGAALRLYFHYQDFDNTYVLEANVDGKVTLLKRFGATQTQLAQADIGSTAIRTKARYAAEVRGAQVQAWRNGRSLFSSFDPGQASFLDAARIPFGTVALEAIQTPGRFANLMLLEPQGGPQVAIGAISPATPTVIAGSQTQFSATVTGVLNSAVIWSASAGTMSASGLWTAPITTAQTQVTITAAAHADASKKVTTVATVNPVAAITAFTATPATITSGQSASLSATFSGGTGVITPGNLAITSGGSVSVSPTVTTAYTLTVTNPAGTSVARSTTVMVTSAGPFAQQGPKLVGKGAEGQARQGSAVSFSADGNTAIVGGPIDNFAAGAVWIWTRSGGAWTQQGTKLVGSGAIGPEAEQGLAVALSGDGNTAIVGGPTDDRGVGAAWIWTRIGEVWTQQGTKLVGSDAVGNAGQGWSVSLSADGNTAIVGGPNNSAAWIWTRSGGVWTQQGTKLVGSGAAGNSSQGASVCLSADGNTAIVGGHADNGYAGAAWVWTRSGGVWTQQGTKLVGSDASGNAKQGFSVSLSGDGNTAIVGGYADNGGAGAAWVWTRSGGVWTQQGTKLVGSGAMGSANQGYSVSLAGDGNTILVGGRSDTTVAGAAWVWTKSGGIWSQQGTKLIGSGGVYAQQGYSVSLTGDGDTAIVGGQDDTFGRGAAWVWSRSGGAWAQQGPKLVGSGTDGKAAQGQAVSLSADGNTAIVGGPADNVVSGAAWVWTRSGGVWTQQGPKLVGTEGVGPQVEQGWSVSLSGDGNTAIVGGPSDNNNAGAVWVWTRSGGVWTQQGTKLVGSGAVGKAYQGASVSLSGDGNTAIVSGGLDNGYTGAVWVWTRNGGVWTQQGPKLVGQVTSVALSADGNTAIVGAYGENNNEGAARVWTRSGGVWTQQGTKLVCSGASGNAQQGYSVSLSADGNTAIIGGPADNGAAGAAWVWTRSGGVWTQQGTKLVGSGASGNAQQGYSVSLSGDGNTAIVVGSRDGVGRGAAWVWTRSGGIWTQQGTKLVGSGAVGFAQYFSVSLSTDGKTAMVGGNEDNGFVGAAWVFTR